MTGDPPPAPAHPLGTRLGYLLKHAQAQLAEASARALEPYGVDGRELAVLAVLAADTEPVAAPLSQSDAAHRLGVDRTTMVALVDALEGKGLVERQRSAQDRRRNAVRLTPAGHDLRRRAEAARQEMERHFLAPLPAEDAAAFVRALQTLALPRPSKA